MTAELFSGQGDPRIVVSGGSIAGLGAGVALHRAGIGVHVFERDAGPLRSAGAGLVVQPELVALAGPELPMTRCSGRRTLSPDGQFGRFQSMPQQFTSWDAVHATLRSRLPAGLYHMDCRVEGATRRSGHIDIGIAGLGIVEADLLIAADGGQSATRRMLLPNLEPAYAGYVAWRGTVSEREMPGDILDAFDDVFTFCDARSGGHALAYFIPGDELGTGPGERRINWVWYVGADPDERDALLVTRDGTQRRASLRRGMARNAEVEVLRRRSLVELHPMFARLVELTPDPFLQTVVDLGAPRTVFDRTVLIGDAAFVVRPHTAGGAAKAARDALSLADFLSRSRSNIDAALEAFQREQLAYGRALLDYGVQLGQRWARL